MPAFHGRCLLPLQTVRKRRRLSNQAQSIVLNKTYSSVQLRRNDSEVRATDLNIWTEVHLKERMAEERAENRRSDAEEVQLLRRSHKWVFEHLLAGLWCGRGWSVDEGGYRRRRWWRWRQQPWSCRSRDWIGRRPNCHRERDSPGSGSSTVQWLGNSGHWWLCRSSLKTANIEQHSDLGFISGLGDLGLGFISGSGLGWVPSELFQILLNSISITNYTF